jgi:hypothetical protein
MDERGRTRPLADGGLRDGKRKSGRWERAKIGRAEVGKRRRWDGGKSRRLEKMKKECREWKIGKWTNPPGYKGISGIWMFINLPLVLQ